LPDFGTGVQLEGVGLPGGGLEGESHYERELFEQEWQISLGGRGLEIT
jgi:hypothetical protein